MLAAGFGAARYPLVGLIAGLVMTTLVVLGWMLAKPLDGLSRTATDIPSEALRHGAYMPLVLGGAMVLIGMGAALVLRPSAPGHSEP